MNNKIVSEKQNTANATSDLWQQFLRKEQRRNVVEAKLYTDARILGELRELGPYVFINTIAHAQPTRRNSIRPAIVLRVSIHAERFDPASRLGEMPWKDDFDHYHGGDYIDEMAALVSLFLGIRVKAGPVDREFTENGDPCGRPTQYDPKPVPDLLIANGSLQIPRLSGDRNLVDLQALEGFPNHSIQESNTLIKAARMYQQAVWIADSDPALAWLLLVSAVETTAVKWAGDTGTAREKLQVGLPEVFQLLSEDSCSHLIDPIAKILAKYTRATKKFIDFLLEFSPPPPAQRPSEFLRFSFEQKHLKKAANIIYQHRSESLHSGTAFPLPMCQFPERVGIGGKQDDAYQEIPLGLATRAQGATWHREVTPMLLHTFEYIARGAITAWWKSLDVSQN